VSFDALTGGISTDLKRIKDAWDVDEEGDFDEFEEDL
jgi:hypothetical protein